jgi:hypothetical protein
MGRPIDSSEYSNSLTVRDNRTGKVYNISCALQLGIGRRVG